MIRISPSILASDFSNLERDVRRVEDAGAEYLHLDVMDGVFVPNISFGPDVVKAIRPHSRAFFDVHLMIVNPEKYVEAFRKAGADCITFHYEAAEDPLTLLKTIRQSGCRAGISVKPATDPAVLLPLLEECDLLLVMTVEPGFGGQKLIPATLDKVRFLDRELTARGLRDKTDLSVDGGISPETISDAAMAGADVFVAGSAVFRAKDAKEAVSALRLKAEQGQARKNGVTK